MRQIILDSQGMQIPVEFDEEQGTIRVAGVRVSIIAVTDAAGIQLQARAPVRGQRGQPWTERRTYILSGAQFWTLISDQPIAHPEQAGLSEAKQMMAGRRRHTDQLSILARLQGHRAIRAGAYERTHPILLSGRSKTLSGWGVGIRRVGARCGTKNGIPTERFGRLKRPTMPCSNYKRNRDWSDEA